MNELQKQPLSSLNPGERTLMSVINVSGYAVTKETIISLIRRLCRKSSICNVFSSHGISFTRSNDILVSYRCGESFELNEFSNADLDLNTRPRKKLLPVKTNDPFIMKMILIDSNW